MVRRVAVVGIGLTPFRVRPNVGWKQLICEAMHEALQDAKMDGSEIQSGYVGCSQPTIIEQIPIGNLVSMFTGLNPIGFSCNSEQCSCGQIAVQNAFLAIKSGACDIAIAIGFDKMSDAYDLRNLMTPNIDDYEKYSRFGSSAIGLGLWYKLHFRAHGEPTREQLALYAVHARKQASKNSKAFYYNARDITVEDFLQAPIVVEPLGSLDATRFVLDAAGAMILANEEVAKKYRDDLVFIKGLSYKNDCIYQYNDPNYVFMPALKAAAKEAYHMAGIGAKNLDFACLHDCWAFFAPIELEALGVCEEKKAGKFIEDGEMKLDGRLPCDTDGGIYGRGHPPGASGLANGVEAVTQLRENAGERQVKDAKTAVSVMIGASSRNIIIYGRD